MSEFRNYRLRILDDVNQLDLDDALLTRPKHHAVPLAEGKQSRHRTTYPFR